MGESRSQPNSTIAPDSVRPVGEPEVSSRPDHWQRMELGDLVTQTRERAKDRAFEVMSCSKIHGVILQSEKFKRRVASKNVSNYKVLDSGSFVYDPMLLWDGSIGRNDYGFPGVVSPAYNVFEANHRVDAAYLEYLLRSPAMIPQYARISEGTNVRRRKAKFDDFARIPLLLPPLAEQRSIANVLRSVEKAVQTTEQVIEASRELKRSLMNHLFTYGPVPVDEAEQVPLKETEIGPVPEHWKVAALGEVAVIGNGSTPKRSNPAYWADGNIPWLNSAKVHEGTVLQADQFVTELARSECHLPLVPKGSVIVAITGQGKTLGNAAMMGLDACVNQHLAYLRFRSPDVVPEFVLTFLQQRYQDLRQAARGGGSTKGALTCGFLKSYSMPLPPAEEQRQIARILLAVDAKLASEEKRKASMNVVFKVSLHNLMTGRVRVNDLDLSAVEEVV